MDECSQCARLRERASGEGDGCERATARARRLLCPESRRERSGTPRLASGRRPSAPPRVARPGHRRPCAGQPLASAPRGSRGSMAPKRRAAPGGGVWLRAGACLLAWAAFCRVRASACPAPCACSGTTIDCHGLGLRSVPKNVPRSAERL